LIGTPKLAIEKSTTTGSTNRLIHLIAVTKN